MFLIVYMTCRIEIKFYLLTYLLIYLYLLTYFPKTFINYCHVHRDPQLSIHVFLAMCGFPEGHDCKIL